MKKIFILEDDRNHAALLKGYLDKDSVTVAGTIEEAASYMRESFDAAFIDIRINGNHRAGVNFAALYRDIHPNTSITAITGYPDLIPEISKYVDNVLEKPYTLKDVQTILRKIDEDTTPLPNDKLFRDLLILKEDVLELKTAKEQHEKTLDILMDVAVKKVPAWSIGVMSFMASIIAIATTIIVKCN